MRKHHGQEGRVYIRPRTGGAALTMECALSNWSLDTSAETAETTSFCSGNKEYVRGKPDLTGTLAGFWDSDSDLLFEAADDPAGCDLLLYPSHLVPEHYWMGPAWLSASIDVPVDGPVTIEGEFSANGTWVRAPAATV